MKEQRKSITIHDIAQATGFTASTVSRALQNDARISEATRNIINSYAQKVKYRSNSVASSLRTGKSKTIGVIIPLINRSFFASVIAGIENVLRKSEYNVIICQTDNDYQNEKEAIAVLLKARVDGIAISVAAGTKTFKHIQAVKNVNIPLILFDRTFDEIGASEVVVDDFKGAKLATAHLIEQGCKKIVHIAGFQHMTIYKNRFLGYKAALEEHGIEYDKQLVVEGSVAEGSGEEHLNTIMERGVAFDAIFTASDFAAVNVMLTLKAKGIRVPEDVAIVGFSDEPFTKLVTPTVSTVSRHSLEMGDAVGTLFLLMVEEDDTQTIRKVVLEPTLMVRQSSLKT